jgi:hypothetical protein
MERKIAFTRLFSLLMMAGSSCYESYQPPGIDSSASYLVVDAFINSTDGSVSVMLSNTLPLSSTDSLQPVNGAKVQVIDDSGSMLAVPFTDSGLYAVSGLSIIKEKKYKLVISSAGKAYESDFVPVNQAPPIDTLNWSIDRDYLNINVSTHDPTGSSKFYRWKFTETWKYRSMFLTPYIVKNDSVVPRTKEEDISICWQTLDDSKIVIYSTDYLAQDRVDNFTVQRIASNSLKLTSRYSILVQQQTLTKEAYIYWLNVKKTTESLGSLFDPLPAAVRGNIRCVTNTAEPVIGFFSVGSVSSKRIYIDQSDLGSFTNYDYPPCGIETVVCDTVHNKNGWYGLQPRIKFENPDMVIGQITKESLVVGYLFAPRVCTDCRELAAGKTKPPGFWKD